MLPVPVEIFLCAIHILKNFLDLSLVERNELYFRLHICSTTFQFEIIYAEFKNEVNTIDVNMTGDYLVSAGKDATVRLYDTRNTKVNIEILLSV